LLALYLSGYAWARMTRRLIYRGPGSGVTSRFDGIGFTTEEELFLPLIFLESTVRR
jgi:hypothetical protein